MYKYYPDSFGADFSFRCNIDMVHATDFKLNWETL